MNLSKWHIYRYCDHHSYPNICRYHNHNSYPNISKHIIIIILIQIPSHLAARAMAQTSWNPTAAHTSLDNLVWWARWWGSWSWRAFWWESWSWRGFWWDAVLLLKDGDDLVSRFSRFPPFSFIFLRTKLLCRTWDDVTKNFHVQRRKNLHGIVGVNMNSEAMSRTQHSIACFWEMYCFWGKLNIKVQGVSRKAANIILCQKAANRPQLPYNVVSQHSISIIFWDTLSSFSFSLKRE